MAVGNCCGQSRYLGSDYRLNRNRLADGWYKLWRNIPLSEICTMSAKKPGEGATVIKPSRRPSRMPVFTPGRAALWPASLSILAALLFGGCNDPYSQRRIAMRREHLHQTATDVADRERDGVRRVREADETLKKWWKRDVEDFERRAPTVGDYFW
ncbi:MAG TPA: hypothetical protein VJZ71_10500 [Phycisphaerae bacterium]|nr:hypothetical protein [Phycisphaerae bacterium]